MNQFETIIITSVCAIITGSVVRLFLKTNTNSDEIIRLKLEIKQLKENQNHGFEQLEKLLDEKFKRIDDRFVHMDKTIQSSAKLFEVLIDEVKKK